jgi:hypothetical protein
MSPTHPYILPYHRDLPQFTPTRRYHEDLEIPTYVIEAVVERLSTMKSRRALYSCDGGFGRDGSTMRCGISTAPESTATREGSSRV